MDNIFFKELAEKMEKQSNRATQFPIFVIQVDKKVYGDASWCNESERKDESDGEMCDACKVKNEDGEAPDYCTDCDSDCFVWFNWEKEFDLQAGFFFTEEACENHIKQNHYHYENPKSYVISAWRNPEIQMLFTKIFELAGKEIPSQYK